MPTHLYVFPYLSFYDLSLCILILQFQERTILNFTLTSWQSDLKGLTLLYWVTGLSPSGETKFLWHTKKSGDLDTLKPKDQDFEHAHMSAATWWGFAASSVFVFIAILVLGLMTIYFYLCK